jgi:hypothetical protein
MPVNPFAAAAFDSSSKLSALSTTTVSIGSSRIAIGKT